MECRPGFLYLHLPRATVAKIDLEVSSTKTDFPDYSHDNWKMNGRLGSRIKGATV